jgi:transposase
MEQMKSFIKKHWGSQLELAEHLGVTTATVQNWLKKNPRGILKYGPEIVRDKDVTFTQLNGEVYFRECEMQEGVQ